MVWLFVIAGVALISVGISYVCYRMAFYVNRKKTAAPQPIQLPDGQQYAPYRQDMERWALQTRAMPYRELSVTARDGLTLYGKFYEYAPGAPVELMFHGYRGTAERDLSGGVQRCFLLGHSALVVDQRGSGKSGGHTITFGVREHWDCLKWVEKLNEEFPQRLPLILTGISMGAATVVMAAGRELPDNVIGVLADCGYSSARQIIRQVIRKMGLPATLAYPFVRLGAWLFGGFSLESYDPLQALSTCRVPVIFFHGRDDRFVPCDMSRQMYEACGSRKKLVTVPGAGHGMSYLVDPEGYIAALQEFFPERSQ